MLKSLGLYSKNFGTILFRRERNLILHDKTRFLFKPSVFDKIPACSQDSFEASLADAISWLLVAASQGDDDGIPSYHLVEGWTSSYPETTGYIIPGLLRYSGLKKNEPAGKTALNAARWLVDIQKDEGGWQGGRIADDRPMIVFNTAQVVRGLLAAYENTREQLFLDSLVRGCDWLSQVQDKAGFWKKHALMEESRVYDSYVDVPLIMAHSLTGNEKYKDVAVRNLEWILGKQYENGWFPDCDNTIKRNDRPIIHTIAYTIDGLIDSGLALDEPRFIEAARKPADKLKEAFLSEGYLNGRYDSQWNGSEYFICTGGAQMAISWMKLYSHYNEEEYLMAAGSMLELLIFIQQRKINEGPNTRGAISGSFPVWGRYEPFALPNWATKYLADALMDYMEINRTGIKDIAG